MSKLRMLYSSNSFWARSGYGVQGASLLPRLAELPEFGGTPGSEKGRSNIAGFFWYGLAGGTQNFNGFHCYPGVGDPYGNDVIGAHMRDWGANWLVSLIDVWVMNDTVNKVKPALWTPWLPIDHDPVPQRVLDCLAGAHLPLTYAKWGHKMLTDAGVANHYIPHGVEPTIYKVIPDRAKIAEFKRRLTGIDNAHLSVMVSANKGFPDRKWFQGQLRAWAEFAKDKPNARLYLHTEPTPMYGGLDLMGYAQMLGIREKTIFVDRYKNAMGYPPEYLSLVFNAADVLLQVSMSEGFGIPLIEAQACGCPVITTNFSAMPELVRWGHLVDVQEMVLTPMMAFQALPSARHMVQQMQRLYESWEVCGGDWPISKRLRTSKAIHDEYDWDAIVRDQWAPLVTRIANEAPPLDTRFTVGGVEVPHPVQDDAQGFVDVLNEELRSRDIAQELRDDTERLAQAKPKRRVAPLTPEAVTA